MTTKLLLLALGAAAVAGDGGARDAAPPTSQPAIEDIDIEDALPAEPTLVFPTVERMEFSVGGKEAELLLLLTTDPGRALAAAQRARTELTRVYAALDATPGGVGLGAVAQASGQPVALAPEVFDALVEAQRVAGLSSGAFDPTAAPLYRHWGFDARGAVPEPDALKAALAQVDFHRLSLDEARHTATLAAGAELRLGPVRRGAALERAAEVLVQANMTNFIIRCGGDLVVRGTKGGKPWMVGIQDPRGSGYFAAFPASDQAIATVGDYDRFFFRAGVRFHDVLDPRTGVPARRTRSATVVAERADTASALATAAFVLGPEAGIDLVNRLRNVEAVLVDDQNRVHMSPGLADVVRFRPPTDGV